MGIRYVGRGTGEGVGSRRLPRHFDLGLRNLPGRKPKSYKPFWRALDELRHYACPITHNHKRRCFPHHPNGSSGVDFHTSNSLWNRQDELARERDMLLKTSHVNWGDNVKSLVKTNLLLEESPDRRRQRIARSNKVPPTLILQTWVDLSTSLFLVLGLMEARRVALPINKERWGNAKSLLQRMNSIRYRRVRILLGFSSIRVLARNWLRLRWRSGSVGVTAACSNRNPWRCGGTPLGLRPRADTTPRPCLWKN